MFRLYGLLQVIIIATVIARAVVLIRNYSSPAIEIGGGIAIL